MTRVLVNFFYDLPIEEQLAILERIVNAATELLENTVTYEQALSDYFRDLKAATSDIWSIDGVHLAYL